VRVLMVRRGAHGFSLGSNMRQTCGAFWQLALPQRGVGDLPNLSFCLTAWSEPLGFSPSHIIPGPSRHHNLRQRQIPSFARSLSVSCKNVSPTNELAKP